MTKSLLAALVAVLAVLAAAPASAQEPDPYGEVLPGDIIADIPDTTVPPGDTTVPPDGDVRPGGEVRPTGDVASRGADRGADSRVAADRVTPAAPGALPRTGGLTFGTLLLAVALLATGGGAVLTARRRRRG